MTDKHGGATLTYHKIGGGFWHRLHDKLDRQASGYRI